MGSKLSTRSNKQVNKVEYVSISFWSHCYNEIKQSTCSNLGMNRWDWLLPGWNEKHHFGSQSLASPVYQEFSWNDASKIALIVSMFENLVFITFLVVALVYMECCQASSCPLAYTILYALQVVFLFTTCAFTTVWLERNYQDERQCHYREEQKYH